MKRRLFRILLVALMTLSCSNNIAIGQESKGFKVTPEQQKEALAKAKQWIKTYRDSLYIYKKTKFTFDTLQFHVSNSVNHFLDSMEKRYDANGSMNLYLYDSIVKNKLYETDAEIYELCGRYLKDEYHDFCTIYFRFGIHMNLLSIYYEIPDFKMWVYFDSHGKGDSHFHSQQSRTCWRTLGGKER